MNVYSGSGSGEKDLFSVNKTHFVVHPYMYNERIFRIRFRRKGFVLCTQNIMMNTHGLWIKQRVLEISGKNTHWKCTNCKISILHSESRNKGKGNGAGLAWESQSHCFADQYGNLTHTLLVQTHNMTTVKKIAKYCRQLIIIKLE